MSADAAVRVRPRDRILETARVLFHKHGIRGVGVDAIAEAAGTNKMTLYRHFNSKDELIAEYLQTVASDAAAVWRELEDLHPGDHLAQLRAWVRAAADCVLADPRGCDLANAAIELTEVHHPARRIIEDFKRAQRKQLTRLCREAGTPRPELLADTLSLLLEGARATCQSVGPKGPSAQFVHIAEMVIESSMRATRPPKIERAGALVPRKPAAERSGRSRVGR